MGAHQSPAMCIGELQMPQRTARLVDSRTRLPQRAQMVVGSAFT